VMASILALAPDETRNSGEINRELLLRPEAEVVLGRAVRRCRPTDRFVRFLQPEAADPNRRTYRRAPRRGRRRAALRSWLPTSCLRTTGVLDRREAGRPGCCDTDSVGSPIERCSFRSNASCKCADACLGWSRRLVMPPRAGGTLGPRSKGQRQAAEHVVEGSLRRVDDTGSGSRRRPRATDLSRRPHSFRDSRSGSQGSRRCRSRRATAYCPRIGGPPRPGIRGIC
jgi:hypothetical protein